MNENYDLYSFSGTAHSIHSDLSYFDTIVYHVCIFILKHIFYFSLYTFPELKAPSIVEDPSDISVLKKHPATLNCKAEGNPDPEILWFKDGYPFDLESEGRLDVLNLDGSLFFLDVAHKDAGIYWCVARNSRGSTKSQNATLTVACKCVISYFILAYI
jgi:hypothetical protein